MDFRRNKKRQLMQDVQNMKLMDEYRGNQDALGIASDYALKFGDDGVKAISNKLANTTNKNLLNAGADTAKDFLTSNTAQKALIKEGTEQVAEQGVKAGLKGAGKALGKIAPVVGGAMSAKEAYDDFSEGDYVGGALNTISGVASFVPGIGTAISAVADGLNALKDIKKNDEMKAIAKSQQAIAENQASALGNLAEKKQEIKQQQADNLVNAPMVQPDMSSMPVNDTLAQTDSISPMVIQPTLVEPHNIPAENIAQPVDKSGVVSNILNSVKGMAGKVDNAVDLTQDRIGGMVDNALAKTKSGVNDFMAGYQDNRNNGFEQGDFYNQIKEQEPQTTTDEQGNVVLQGGTEETKKSIMAKLGEMMGTAGRLASNPYLQGLIAGGIYKATGGDAGESIKYGVDWAQNKAKSDHYANAMGKTPGVLIGDYNATDYNAYANKEYRDNMVANMADRIRTMEENYANQQKHKEEELKFLKEKFGKEFGEKVRHNKTTEGIQAKNAKTRTNKGNNWNSDTIKFYNEIVKKLNASKEQAFENKKNAMNGWFHKATDKEVNDALANEYSLLTDYADAETLQDIQDLQLVLGEDPNYILELLNGKK
jgi:hypothetical protein